jgi:hypothetical protein
MTALPSIHDAQASIHDGLPSIHGEANSFFIKKRLKKMNSVLRRMNYLTA